MLLYVYVCNDSFLSLSERCATTLGCICVLNAISSAKHFLVRLVKHMFTGEKECILNIDFVLKLSSSCNN